jgi:hypothetical protein
MVVCSETCILVSRRIFYIFNLAIPVFLAYTGIHYIYNCVLHICMYVSLYIYVHDNIYTDISMYVYSHMYIYAETGAQGLVQLENYSADSTAIVFQVYIHMYK